VLRLFADIADVNVIFGEEVTGRITVRLKRVRWDRALSAIDRSKDVQNFVDRRIQSSVSYRKAWGNTKLSFSANRVQKLDVTSPSENRVTMQFPTLSLNFPTTSLWPLAKHAEGEQGIAERVLRGFTFAPNLRMDVSHEESDWLWCTNRQGHSGWIPAENVESV